MFHTNDDLPLVQSSRFGSRELLCDGGAVFTLPDGREVYMPDPSSWPDVFQDEMPWEEDVEQAAAVGPSQNLSDRTEQIDTLVAEWNEQHGWAGGDEEGETSGSGDSDAGSAGDLGQDDESSGCACSSDGNGRGTLAMLGLLGVFGLHTLRRRD